MEGDTVLISFPSGRDRSRGDSAARVGSQPPERERSSATRTKLAVMSSRGFVYVPEMRKTNPVSHGQCVSVHLSAEVSARGRLPLESSARV